ncbi:helix-turn-helix domain-containing protein [Kitasatospora sp. NBC_00240]|uniref:helix-turn-helix transcriptional regulator n=1 Tax=Kitasatospora sp. NBC_00240 TaxID=2903567 RepID=UPI002B1D08AF|nr:helix-turn-helix domain-containing protein [Kitasatospora sp. NBC_00240]
MEDNKEAEIRMLTVKEVANRLGVSQSTVYRWVQDGELAAERDKKPSPVKRKRNYQGNIRIPEGLVDAMLAGEQEAA